MSKYDAILPLTQVDNYKLGHHSMELAKSEYALANFTPRGSREPETTHIVSFGLQAFLKKWAIDSFAPFFAADEDEVAAQWEDLLATILGPDSMAAIGSDHIRKLHRKGYLPLRFNALPEGTLVPLRVPFFTVENTDPDFYWLVNFIETAVSSSVWQAATSATRGHNIRQLFNKWALKTTGSTEGVEWQGHDFSARGQHSIESAAASGAGHLLSFLGSDTAASLPWIEDYYAGFNGLIMGSVAATEHAIMTLGGNAPGQEQATYKRLMDKFPAGILSVVSDTWNLWSVLNNILPALHDQIMARDGKLVIRPDSGDPVEILTGTSRPGYVEDASVKTGDKLAASKGVIELLWDEFGGTINSEGYKILDPHVGAIYGDAITAERAEQIFQRLADKGFASTNVVLGLGSFFYSGLVTRDTYGFAYKNTYATVDGVGREMFKDPITDDGLKKSAKGRMAVVRKDDNELHLIDGEDGAKIEHTSANLLKTVWEDGNFIQYQSLDEVRAVLAAQSN